MLFGKPFLLASGATFAALLVGGLGWFLQQTVSANASAGEGSSSVSVETPGAQVGASRHEVHIRPGPETPRVLATLPDSGGKPAFVSCSTCHATRRPELATASSAALDEFHQGLHYRHGDLSCLSCHNAGNYDTLRRADGRALEFPDTIQLCAQCHGPQYRDYRNGSHGGMTGHWDLRAGGRVRNTCVDCHDSHAPAYPRVRPVFAPQDRGAHQQRERQSAHATSPSDHE